MQEEKAKHLYMCHKSEKRKTSRKIEKPLHESRIRNAKHIEKERFLGGWRRSHKWRMMLTIMYSSHTITFYCLFVKFSVWIMLVSVLPYHLFLWIDFVNMRKHAMKKAHMFGVLWQINVPFVLTIHCHCISKKQMYQLKLLSN